MTKDNIATRYSDNKETSPQRDNDKGKYSSPRTADQTNTAHSATVTDCHC